MYQCRWAPLSTYYVTRLVYYTARRAQACMSAGPNLGRTLCVMAITNYILQKQNPFMLKIPIVPFESPYIQGAMGDWDFRISDLVKNPDGTDMW